MPHVSFFKLRKTWLCLVTYMAYTAEAFSADMQIYEQGKLVLSFLGGDMKSHVIATQLRLKNILTTVGKTSCG